MSGEKVCTWRRLEGWMGKKTHRTLTQETGSCETERKQWPVDDLLIWSSSFFPPPITQPSSFYGPVSPKVCTSSKESHQTWCDLKQIFQQNLKSIRHYSWYWSCSVYFAMKYLSNFKYRSKNELIRIQLLALQPLLWHLWLDLRIKLDDNLITWNLTATATAGGEQIKPYELNIVFGAGQHADANAVYQT